MTELAKTLEGLSVDAAQPNASPLDQATFLIALETAYRTGQLVPAQSGDVEAVARAIRRSEIGNFSDEAQAQAVVDGSWEHRTKEATAAIAAMTSAKDAEIAALQAELAEARNECLEQARLLGMSAERELDLQARLVEAREVPGKIVDWIKSGAGPYVEGYGEEIATAIEARDWSK